MKYFNILSNDRSTKILFLCLSSYLIVFIIILSWFGFNFEITTDLFYIPTLFKNSIYNFRFPPSTYALPDFAYYFISGFFSKDTVDRLVISGILQVIVCGIFIARLYGPITWLFVGIAYFLFDHGELFLISFHYNVILFTALFLSMDSKYRPMIILVGGISDPLFLIIVLLKMISESFCGKYVQRRNSALIFIVWFVNFFLCEASYELAKIFPIIFLHPLMLMAARAIGERIRTINIYRIILNYFTILTEVEFVFSASLVAIFLYFSINATIPKRYTAVILCTALLSGSKIWDRETISYIKSFAANSILLLFFATSVYSGLVESGLANLASFRCLADELLSRGVTTVGTGYWVSKPLIYADKRRTIKVIPVDFRTGGADTWQVPYSSSNGEFQYVVKDNSICQQNIPDTEKFCSLLWLEGNIENDRVETVCQKYDLIPLNSVERFSDDRGKIARFKDNLFEYWKKTRRKLKI